MKSTLSIIRQPTAPIVLTRRTLGPQKHFYNIHDTTINHYHNSAIPRKTTSRCNCARRRFACCLPLTLLLQMGHYAAATPTGPQVRKWEFESSQTSWGTETPVVSQPHRSSAPPSQSLRLPNPRGRSVEADGREATDSNHEGVMRAAVRAVEVTARVHHAQCGDASGGGGITCQEFLITSLVV